MSSYPHSLVTIAPAATRDALLALGAAYGVDAGMAVELSADGDEPVTHYGSHAWASPQFVAVVTQQVLVVPEGYTEQQVSDILGSCVFSVDPVVSEVTLVNRAHFEKVLADEGLQEITQEI